MTSDVTYIINLVTDNYYELLNKQINIDQAKASINLIIESNKKYEYKNGDYKGRLVSIFPDNNKIVTLSIIYTFNDCIFPLYIDIIPQFGKLEPNIMAVIDDKIIKYSIKRINPNKETKRIKKRHLDGKLDYRETHLDNIDNTSIIVEYPESSNVLTVKGINDSSPTAEYPEFSYDVVIYSESSNDYSSTTAEYPEISEDINICSESSSNITVKVKEINKFSTTEKYPELSYDIIIDSALSSDITINEINNILNSNDDNIQIIGNDSVEDNNIQIISNDSVEDNKD